VSEPHIARNLVVAAEPDVHGKPELRLRAATAINLIRVNEIVDSRMRFIHVGPRTHHPCALDVPLDDEVQRLANDQFVIDPII
jgi:hypothetical protein